MEITEVAWSDDEDVRRFTDLTNAVRQVDSPWEHPMTPHECVGELRYGWDGDPATGFLVSEDGVDVAAGEYHTSTYDNHHLAWLGVHVHPAWRRRRYGTELLGHLTDRAVAEGRASIGIDAWEAEAPLGFATHHGLMARSVEVMRRQLLGDLDWSVLDSLYDEARTHARDYELVRQLGATSDDQLEAVAVMVSAINDAPSDDLDVEDDVFTAARIRAYDEAQAARGRLVHIVMARHRETGALAGETTVVVDLERPQLAAQHDTSVVREHRGHRLGLMLKLDMLRWLRETQPQLESIDTWNAESNAHMIRINEALGYRVVGRALAFQRPL